MFPKSREKEESFRDFNSDRVQVGVKNIDKICRRHLSMALMMERLTESAKLASSEPKSISLLVTINLLFLSSSLASFVLVRHLECASRWRRFFSRRARLARKSQLLPKFIIQGGRGGKLESAPGDSFIPRGSPAL